MKRNDGQAILDSVDLQLAIAERKLGRSMLPIEEAMYRNQVKFVRADGKEDLPHLPQKYERPNNSPLIFPSNCNE